MIQDRWPDSGGAADVDHREPTEIRPRQAALSQRCRRRRMGAYRVADPASQTRRAQALGRFARSCQRPDVRFEHGLPVALRAEGFAAARSRLFDYFDLWTWDGTLERI